MPHAKLTDPGISKEWQQRLGMAIDLGIASTVLFAPLFMGGRGPIGRFVFVLCVAVTGALWCVRQCIAKEAVWRKTGAEILLLAGLGFLILQLIPWPSSIISLLSPHVSELLPLWNTSPDSGFRLGIWNQVSLHPMATQSGLATYVAYATLFLVTFQRLEEVRDVQRLLRLLAVSTCFMAVVGLAQFLFGNGKFLWVYEHVSRDTSYAVKGPFQNQNHFAHLLALGIGPLLWWLSSSQSNPRKHRGFTRLGHSTVPAQALWIALGTVTFAALLTFSRGGVIAIVLAAASGVALMAWNKMLSRRALGAVATITVVMLISLSIHGYEPLARKLGTFQESQSISELSRGRWELWNAHLKAIPDFWLLGSGVGTHRDIYPTYLEEHFNVEFTHGESGYFSLALETGVIGAGLFLVGLALAARWSFISLLQNTDRKSVACATAIVPGLIASVIHSLGDFVWYIPACMTTTVLLLAAACRVYHASRSATEDAAPISIAAPRLAWISVSLACVFAMAFATSHLARPAIAAPKSYEYLRLANSSGLSNMTPTTLDDMVAMKSILEAAVRANENDARTQLQLASLYLQHFDLAQQSAENPMPLTQIRDAALASQFSSRQQLDNWLDLAVGENRHLFDAALEHALQSVRLCPLQGEAYALLARVAFLEGSDANRKRLYVEQALNVRPFHSRVQFVAGQESLFDGDVKEALSLWKKAFHGEHEVQGELIRELTAVIPANDLLEALTPDQQGLDALISHYKKVGDADSAKVVAVYFTHYLVDQSSSNSNLDQVWTLKKLSSLHEYLDSPDEAIRLAQEAERFEPAEFNAKLRLARLLVKAGRFTEAQAELQWCARRQPDHKETRSLLATANRGAISQQADAAIRPQSGQPFRQ